MQGYGTYILLKMLHLKMKPGEDSKGREDEVIRMNRKEFGGLSGRETNPDLLIDLSL